MDGTLWDASEEVAHSWQEAIQASTITDKVLTKEDFMRVMGKPMDELIEVLFPEAFESGTERAFRRLL